MWIREPALEMLLPTDWRPRSQRACARARAGVVCVCEL